MAETHAFFPLATPPAFYEKMWNTILAGEVWQGEIINRRKDGSTCSQELTITPLADESGKISYFIAFHREIMGHNRAEELLRDQDLYRDLVEHSEDLLCTHDVRGQLLSVNPSPARVLGYAVEELLRIPMRELIAPEFHEQFDEYLVRVQRDGVAKGLMAVLTRTGERRIWDYHNTLRTEGVPSPIVRGLAHDVTERVQAERALRKSEERFRVALKSSAITVFNQDRDLRYTWVHNPQQGWTEQDYLGKTDNEIFAAEDASRLTEIKRQVLETGAGAREVVSITSQGAKYYCDLTVEPLRDSAGKVAGITCSCTDITELHEKTERLQQLTRKLEEEKSYLEGEIRAEHNFEEIVGESPVLKQCLAEARTVAATGSTVLILGETGTGKELVARAIHRMSPRSSHSFIKLNCAAIPTGLLESELFGHEKGAFTSATSQRIGRLELADKGTFFLDEVGDIPLEVQPKLLRVLQDQEFERLGSARTIRVNLRLIAATNRDLARSMAEREFRSDLFYRLNVFPIRLPALRERRQDIPLLVRHFVRKYATRMGKQIESVPSETISALTKWDWPGNIRELENFVERSVILTEGPVLRAPLSELKPEYETTVDSTLAATRREYIVHILQECRGVIAGPNGAAARLGLKRTTLQSRIRRLGISPQEYDAKKMSSEPGSAA